jgi:hypothetical protein
MTNHTDKNQNTPLPATANDKTDASKLHGDTKAAKPETAPTEKPKMDPGSKPAVSAPAQHKNA